MIQVPGFRRARMQGVPYEVMPQSLDVFMPGGDAALDCVCSGILEGTPFVFEEARS